MITSNNDNICCKCYINLFNIVPVEMEGSRQFNCPSYANKLYTSYSQFKKFLKKIFTCFHSRNLELMNLKYL